MRIAIVLGTCALVGLPAAAVAEDDQGPVLASLLTMAPAWTHDCTVKLAEGDDAGFEVVTDCGFDFLAFERGAITTKQFAAMVKREAAELGATPSPISLRTPSGMATGFVLASGEEAETPTTTIVVRRAGKRSSDLYSCTSEAQTDQVTQCRVLIETFARSTVVRRGRAAFTRPKS